MSLERIYLLRAKKLSEHFEPLSHENNVEICILENGHKMDPLEFQGLVILTEGLDTEKDDQELINEFDTNRIPFRKIDLSGTIQVAISGLDLWLKKNNCQQIILTGSDELINNEKLSRFLERFATLVARS